MAAYIYVDLEVTDPVAYEDYRKRVPRLIEAHGGRYLVRGGAAEVLEGESMPKRRVILEFPDMVRLKAFYDSADYRPLKLLRQRASRGTVVAIEGV